jgi:predicted transcriptional regulator
MTSPVRSVAPDTHLDEVHAQLVAQRISSMPVLDASGKALGLVSYTDLLRIGRMQPASLAGVQTLDLPAEPVQQHMHLGLITVAPDAPVARVAATLVEHRIHRVYVEDKGTVVGVLSIEDLLLAVRSLRLESAIAVYMSTSVRTVSLEATIAEATAELDHAGLQGLVVLDTFGQPAGSFTQTEALACRDLLPETQVEVAMSHGLLCMHSTTPLHRAAAAAYEARARRLLAIDEGKLVGVITGLDFARALATR